MNFSQIINMGGYAAYVWPAYGITLAVFGLNLFLALNEKRRIKKQLPENNR